MEGRANVCTPFGVNALV